MYAFSVIGQTGYVYRDGSLVDTVAGNLSDFEALTAARASFGGAASSDSPGIRLAALLYYTRGLSGTEISNIYNNMRSRFGK
jgi:energy-converting hydrogenase Eha subunit F